MSANENFPDELRDLPRWSHYDGETDEFGTPQAFDRNHFHFQLDDGFCLVLLRDAVNAKNEVKPWAQALLKAFGTHANFQPGINGLKILVKGGWEGDPSLQTGHIKLLQAGHAVFDSSVVPNCPDAVKAGGKTLAQLVEYAYELEIADEKVLGELASVPAGKVSDWERDAWLASTCAYLVGNNTCRIEELVDRSGRCSGRWIEDAAYRESTVLYALSARKLSGRPKVSKPKEGNRPYYSEGLALARKLKTPDVTDPEDFLDVVDAHCLEHGYNDEDFMTAFKKAYVAVRFAESDAVLRNALAKAEEHPYPADYKAGYQKAVSISYHLSTADPNREFWLSEHVAKAIGVGRDTVRDYLDRMEKKKGLIEMTAKAVEGKKCTRYRWIGPDLDAN